jgi:hypothetical protein
MADAGKDDRSVTGKAVFEREFTADFAADPAMASLSLP